MILVRCELAIKANVNGSQQRGLWSQDVVESLKYYKLPAKRTD